jgi:hypothetical protein
MRLFNVVQLNNRHSRYELGVASKLRADFLLERFLKNQRLHLSRLLLTLIIVGFHPLSAYGLPIEWQNGELLITVCTYQFSPPTTPCADSGSVSGVATSFVPAILTPASSWTGDNPGEFSNLNLFINDAHSVTLPLTGVWFPRD